MTTQDDDMTQRDIVEYLVGVYRTVTRPDAVQVVNQNDNLVEVVNALIVALAPISAYHLAHGYQDIDPDLPEPEPSGTSN